MMTRPKWIRKRKKAFEALNIVIKESMSNGYIKLRVDNRKIVNINFIKEDKTLDDKKFSSYFAKVIQSLKILYRDARKNKRSRSSKKFLNKDPKEIVNHLLLIVYEGTKNDTKNAV